MSAIDVKWGVVAFVLYTNNKCDNVALNQVFLQQRQMQKGAKSGAYKEKS